MIKDDENYYNQKNFVRDDWGGQVRTPSPSKSFEVTDDNMVNGSSDKPFPTEGNFTTDIAPTQPSGMGVFTPQTDNGNVANTFGQIKYAVREGATSIYKDETRETANDKMASAKAEGSTYCEVIRSNEESQGI